MTSLFGAVTSEVGLPRGVLSFWKLVFRNPILCFVLGEQKVTFNLLSFLQVRLKNRTGLLFGENRSYSFPAKTSTAVLFLLS